MSNSNFSLTTSKEIGKLRRPLYNGGKFLPPLETTDPILKIISTTLGG